MAITVKLLLWKLFDRANHAGMELTFYEQNKINLH
ncbi:hypothetical protein M2273_003471 [Mucilaginibacter lappiensis]